MLTKCLTPCEHNSGEFRRGSKSQQTTVSKKWATFTGGPFFKRLL